MTTSRLTPLSQNVIALITFIFVCFLFFHWIAYIDEGVWRTYNGFWDYLQSFDFNDWPLLIFITIIFTGIAWAIFSGLKRLKELKDGFVVRLFIATLSIPMGVIVLVFILVVMNTVYRI